MAVGWRGALTLARGCVYRVEKTAMAREQAIQLDSLELMLQRVTAAVSGQEPTAELALLVQELAKEELQASAHVKRNLGERNRRSQPAL